MWLMYGRETSLVYVIEYMSFETIFGNLFGVWDIFRAGTYSAWGQWGYLPPLTFIIHIYFCFNSHQIVYLPSWLRCSKLPCEVKVQFLPSKFWLRPCFQGLVRLDEFAEFISGTECKILPKIMCMLCTCYESKIQTVPSV